MPVDAYCGTFKVFENRDTKQGRQIDLNIVVLPALSSDPKPDPFFFLAGGPGKGDAEKEKALREADRQMDNKRNNFLVEKLRSNVRTCIQKTNRDSEGG